MYTKSYYRRVVFFHLFNCFHFVLPNTIIIDLYYSYNHIILNSFLLYMNIYSTVFCFTNILLLFCFFAFLAYVNCFAKYSYYLCIMRVLINNDTKSAYICKNVYVVNNTRSASDLE